MGSTEKDCPSLRTPLTQPPTPLGRPPIPPKKKKNTQQKHEKLNLPQLKNEPTPLLYLVTFCTPDHKVITPGGVLLASR